MATKTRIVFFEKQVGVKKVDVVIWGDFPPQTHTGISMVNVMVENVLQCEGRTIVRVDESAWRLSFVRKVFHYFLCAVKLFDVLILNRCKILYYNLPLSRFGLLKLFLLLPLVRIVSFKTKLVCHIHRGDLNIFSEKSILDRFLLKMCFKPADKAIVLSEIFIEDVKRLNSKIEVSVLANTSSIERSVPDYNKTYSHNFICISNYIRSKGIGELVESFRSKGLENLKLTVFGNIYEPSFVDELNRFKTPNIILNQAISRETLKETLEKFDCLILPSWNEGQPLVILEAMSLGIPVISSNVGDIPNMLWNNYPFLVKPMDLEGLKKCIVDFDNFSNKTELSQRLHHLYLERYSKKKFAEKVLSILG